MRPRRRVSRRNAVPFLCLIALAALASCTDREQPTSPGAITTQEAPPASSAFREGAEPGDAGESIYEIIAYDGTSFSCTGDESVLLIQDVVPWDDPGTSHGLGANVEELLEQQKDFCIIPSSDLGTTDLSVFDEILISAAQTQTFYDNLFPGGDIHDDVEAFVQNGGILSANLADHASGPGSGGNWDGDTFVGGVEHVLHFSQDNDIADPAHPVVADALACPGGNCGVIDDAGSQSDLDDWNSSSHGYFTGLPPGATVILTQPDVTSDGDPEPVFVEFGFGDGIVLATLTTTEWRYVGGIDPPPGNSPDLPENKKLLANEIAYQDFLVCEAANDCVQASVEPGDPLTDVVTPSGFGGLRVPDPQNTFTGPVAIRVELRELEPGERCVINGVFILGEGDLCLSVDVSPADAVVDGALVTVGLCLRDSGSHPGALIFRRDETGRTRATDPAAAPFVDCSQFAAGTNPGDGLLGLAAGVLDRAARWLGLSPRVAWAAHLGFGGQTLCCSDYAWSTGIDIQPGSFPNSINPRGRGRLPVAVLTTDDFDASDVNPASVTLGDDDGDDTPVARRRNGSLFAGPDDVDGDGDEDLILHFETPALVDSGDLTSGTTKLILNGETMDGDAFKGAETVSVVGTGGGGPAGPPGPPGPGGPP